MAVEAQNQRLFLKLRSVRDCLWLRHDRVGYSLDGLELSLQAGAYALGVTANDDFYTDMPLALVSRLDDFWQAEFFGETEPIGAFIHVEPADYSALINWLQRKVRTPKLYLYFNYDAVSLGQMSYLLSMVPEAQVFLPSGNLDAVWQAHGKINLFDPLAFERVKREIPMDNRAMQSVLAMMTKTQRGLQLSSLVMAAKAEEWEVGHG